MITTAFTLALSVLATPGPPSGQAGPETPYTPLRATRLVVLDPGHGGQNRGCLGVDGSFEKDVTLEIARRAERLLLEETSAAVVLTRRGDDPLELRERAALANGWQADLLVSIHLNADTYGRGQGVETWVAGDEDEATHDQALHAEDAAEPAPAVPPGPAADAAASFAEKASRHKAREDAVALAHATVLALHKGTGFPYRGVKQAKFTVLLAAEMPAIVVECGFLSHPREGVELLRPERLEAIARGLVEGIIAYDRQVGGVP